VHLLCILKEAWWTQSEPFIARLELKCTQRVIPSQIEHSATSLRQEDLIDQD
jgi:hypothetical protein